MALSLFAIRHSLLAPHQYGDALPGEIGCLCRKTIVLALSPSVFDRYILAFDKPSFAQTFAKRGDKSSRVAQRPAAQITDHRHGLMLREHRTRPCRQPRALDTEKSRRLMPPSWPERHLRGSKELLRSLPLAAP